MTRSTVPHDTDPDRPDDADHPDDSDRADGHEPTGDIGDARGAHSGDDVPGVEPPETVVPPGEDPEVCPYCDRPFRESATRALHIGERHADRCAAAEREAYESAREAEGDDLFIYHLRVIAALGVLYAVLVLLYMIVLA